jgi:putative DNA primase/helicase
MDSSSQPTPDPFAPLSTPDAGARPEPEPEIWEPMRPPGEPPLAVDIQHFRHGRATARWVYRDGAGKPLFAVARFDLPDGGKEVMPLCFGRRVWTVKTGPNAGTRRTQTQWHFKAPAAPRALYGLEKLAAAPDAAVLLVEGEKTADAALDLFPDMVAMTSQGGAKAMAKADWDVLTGRDVVIWPDHDQAGLDYAQNVAALLQNAASVRIVDVPLEWPDGWDLADVAPVPVVALRAMIDGAARATAPDADEGPRAPQFTDEGLALRFTAKHGDELRYVAAWGRWFEWTGQVWKADETLNTFSMARAICRQASAECNQLKVATVVASAKTVAAVERLAKADRRHAATADQWDADEWLLNTPGGVVDLRTGRMRPHRPPDHMTKITAVAPGGACPQWRTFLNSVTLGNADLQAFLQRVAGYCLTGSIQEHALFFCYGTGANGKGVMLNTLTAILGDYATVASMDTFTASPNDRHPADLAMLRGARMVAAQETEEGRRWAESRIKAMTGGDPITARFMRQDFFTFMPKFKLLIAGNHKPGLRNVDEAIRRRFNLIPFNLKLPIERRDKNLPENLRAEWPGILQWAIEGCLEWQRVGLAPPRAVIDATAEYLSGEDALARWLEECCIVDRTLELGSTPLFQSWKAWADGAGEFAGSQKRFSQLMQSKRFEPGKDGAGRATLKGIGLKKQSGRGERESEPEPDCNPDRMPDW